MPSNSIRSRPLVSAADASLGLGPLLTIFSFTSALLSFVFSFVSVVEALTEPFRDERDVGLVILTPIYLLLGCAMPMWIAHALGSQTSLSAVSLPAAAGVLSLGVGDTSAALAGHW